MLSRRFYPSLYFAPVPGQGQNVTGSQIKPNGQLPAVELIESYPYYLRSQMVEIPQQHNQAQPNSQDDNRERPTSRRTLGPGSAQMIASAPPQSMQQQQQQQQQPQQQQVPYQVQDIDMGQMKPSVGNAGSATGAKCLYDKRYFARFDQCLERRPYPTIGLPAFKNEDLLVRTGLSDKHGCSFILTNGLFKNYQISKYSIDTDTKCLDDNAQVQLSMQLSNVTLYYLWQLRCLNYANQLLDDATLDGKTLAPVDMLQGADNKHSSHKDVNQKHTQVSAGAAGPVCVGSSQTFGFTALQLTNIEAQVELAIDIYKNWRITNITLAMLPSGHKSDRQPAGGSEQASDSPSASGATFNLDHQRPSTAIRDFTFETLDGDELNWRYLNLYENWTRNRLHSNFLDQFKRFVWVSLQRCLSESSDKLPVKLVELFGQQRYN